MAVVINLEGLPDPVADALVDTVLHLRARYKVPAEPPATTWPLKELPTAPGRAIGLSRRVEIYDER